MQQYTLLFKTISIYNLEAYTLCLYSYLPSQSFKQTLSTSNNLERRFIQLYSQLSGQATLTPKLEVRNPCLYTILYCKLCKQQLQHPNNPERQFSFIPHQSSKLRVPFPGKNNNKKKVAGQAKFALLHRELTS